MLSSLLQRAYRRVRYSPLLSQLVVTRRCNLACGYCSEFDQSSEPVPTEVLRRRIDRLAELGSLGLELTGGEPLLHPDRVELVRHASGHGFRMLGMISNGFLLSARLIEELNEAGLTEMQVSVDGVEPSELTIKVLRPLRPKLKELARRARFKVVLSAVVGSGASSDEVIEVVRFAREHGFRPRVLLVHASDGQLGLSSQDLQAYRRVQRMIGRHYKDLFSYREALITRGEAPFRCRAGSRYLYVDEHGLVRWCFHTASVFGKRLSEYTYDDLREQYHTPKACNVRCTLGCARSCSMLDRWLPQSGGEPPPDPTAAPDPKPR